MGRRAGVSAEETRERLLEAAAVFFERKGYDGATVAEIAREADLTTGAIYSRYASKADLLVDAMRAHSAQATATVLPPGSDLDPVEALTMLATLLPRRERPDDVLLVEAIVAARRDPELAEVLAGLLVEREAFVGALIADGQGEGALTSDIPASVGARFALMLALGSMLIDQLPVEPIDDADWHRFVERLVRSFGDHPGR